MSRDRFGRVEDDEFVAFARARLDEDEALIRRNSDGRGLFHGFPDYRTYTDEDTDAADEYINHFGPTRMLHEVEAVRSVIGDQTSLHAPVDSIYGVTCRTCVRWHDDEGAHEFGIAIPESWPCATGRAFGASWADHPDYRDSWKPEPYIPPAVLPPPAD